jgi:hypothetical protein
MLFPQAEYPVEAPLPAKEIEGGKGQESTVQGLKGETELA